MDITHVAANLQRMSVAELKSLSKNHFALMTTEALECLLARMGVALALKERNNKEYYLDKIMELIDELIQAQTNHQPRIVNDISMPSKPPLSAAQHSPITTPAAYLYPSLYSPPVYYPQRYAPTANFSPSSIDAHTSPSAPPLVTMPPFTSEGKMSSGLYPSIYTYDSSQTTTRRLVSPSKRSDPDRRRSGDVMEETRRERQQVTVLFPPRTAARDKSVVRQFIADLIRIICFRLFCVSAGLAPLILALIVFVALSKAPPPGALTWPESSPLFEDPRSFPSSTAQDKTISDPSKPAGKDAHKGMFPLFGAHKERLPRDRREEVLAHCAGMDIVERVKRMFVERRELLRECALSGDSGKGAVIGETDIKSLVKQQLRREGRLSGVLQLDGKDIYDICFDIALDDVNAELAAGTDARLDKVMFSYGAGGRRMFTLEDSQPLLPCALIRLKRNPYVYMAGAAGLLVWMVWWIVQWRMQAGLEERGADWIAKKVREKLLQQCKYDERRNKRTKDRDLYMMDISDDEDISALKPREKTGVAGRQGTGYPVAHLRDFCCSVWRFNNPSYTHLFDKIWSKVEDMNLNDTRIKETERWQDGQLVRYWQWDASTSLEDN